MLQILFVTVVAPLVVGVALEIIKSWLKDQHNTPFSPVSIVAIERVTPTFDQSCQMRA